MEFSPERLAELNDNSLYGHLGMKVLQVGQGKAASVLRPDPAVCWPFEGQPHGGILFTLMDTTMAWAVLSEVEEGQSCATISMEVQYTQRALGAEFYCQAKIKYQAGRVIYTRADITDQAGGLLATAQAAFRVVKGSF